MLMFQRSFDHYTEMIKYLLRCQVDKADFKFEKGKWILNTVKFDKN